MKCPTCKKDFAKGVKAVYKLGVLEGENRLRRTINCIEKTHRQLLKELLRLDRVQPTEAVCIKMSRGEAERLMKFLLKHKHKYQAHKIKKIITSQIDKPAIDEIIKILVKGQNR